MDSMTSARSQPEKAQARRYPKMTGQVQEETLVIWRIDSCEKQSCWYLSVGCSDSRDGSLPREASSAEVFDLSKDLRVAGVEDLLHRMRL